MSGFLGRSIQFTWKGSQIGGVRQKGIELNGEPVNVTADEDAGWRTLLDEAGEDAVNLTISGVTKSDVLKRDWFNRTRMGAVQLDYPDGGVITGQFFIASYTETGAYNDATTFDLTLQSSGQVSFDAASSVS